MSTLLRVISSSPILGWFEDLMDNIIGVLIGPILWGLCDIFFLILDMFETLYRKFAGLEEITLGGVTSTGDPVLFLINSDIVQEVFFSVLILSLFLLVIFTIFAVVKNIYVEKPKPTMEIINKSVKALLLYLLVPIATIICLLVGNVVLVAIDGATKMGGASTTSDMLFLSASYNASKLRDDTDEKCLTNLNYMLKHGMLIPDESSEGVKEDNKHARTRAFEEIMSSQGIDVNSQTEIDDNRATEIDWEVVAGAVDEAYAAGVIGGGNKWYFGTVRDYYYVLKINLLIVWVGGAFMIWAMGKITWGLLSRLFKMTLFFALSPAVMAMMPIKDDAALKSWTGEMVKNGTMAYCAIGVLNVLYSILPAFGQLKLFDFSLLNSLARLFIYIVAFSSAEKLISTVSGWFGTGDALAEGKATAGQIKAAAKKTGDFGKKTSGVFAGMMGGRAAAKDQDKKFFGQLRGAFSGAVSQTGFAKARQDAQKNWDDAKKAASSYYENATTKTWFGGDKMKTLKDEHGNVVRDGDGRKIKYSAADVYKATEQLNKEDKKLAKLYDDLAAATTEVQRQIILNKIREVSSLVKERIADLEAGIQVREAETADRNEVVGYFDELRKSGESIQRYANKLLGRTATGGEIQLLQQGNLDALTGRMSDSQKTAFETQWASIGSLFNQAVNTYESAQDNLSKLYTSDTRVKHEIDTTHDLQDYATMQVGSTEFDLFTIQVDQMRQDVEAMKSQTRADREAIKNITSHSDQRVKSEKASITEKEKIGKKAGK